MPYPLTYYLSKSQDLAAGELLEPLLKRLSVDGRQAVAIYLAELTRADLRREWQRARGNRQPVQTIE